jgi:hypothetical protein
MNERIKELMAQADKFAAENKTQTISGLGNNYFELLHEKFAELIVRECINIVNEQKECLHEEEKYWHDRDYGYEMAVNDASKGIKQFFGVEE